MAAHSSILAWRSHGQRSLVGYSPWDHTESDTTERTQHRNMNFYILCLSCASQMKAPKITWLLISELGFPGG